MFIQVSIGTGPGDLTITMIIGDITTLIGIHTDIIIHIGIRIIGIGTDHTTPIIITSQVTDQVEMCTIPEGVV